VGGKVFLVGAGPGDPGLVTLRGARAIGRADLLLHDALSHPSLLDLSPPGAERIDVGKHAGEVDGVVQGEIEARMIAAARAGKTVVRLKGGDPYLFGRGSEEAEALWAAGVPFEVIPGVSSPVAAAAYAGLPFTHREVASIVTYVTGHESADKPERLVDFHLLARVPGTIVILMGMRHLASIVDELLASGKPATTPTAIVQWASRPDQRTVTGTLGEIVEKSRTAGMGSPAVVILGDVVRHRDHLRWFDRRPLFGRRVLVTRAREQAGTLAEALWDEGAEPVLAPTIEIDEPADPAPLRAAALGADRYDWIVFTSANAVRRFFDALITAGGDVRRLGRVRILAIGPATAEALHPFGLRPDLVPAEHRGEAAAQVLLDLEPMAGKRILLPRAEAAREVIAERLRAAGAIVESVVAYRTVMPADADKATIGARLAAGEIDAAAFTSSSTLRNFVEMFGAAALARVVVASIGPVTTQTARDLGVEVQVEANPYTVEGLVRALAAHFGDPDALSG